MVVLTEGKLQITIDNAIAVRKFDGPTHRLSHCMKAVDFIIELSDRYLFIEFKDPQNADDGEETEPYLIRFEKGNIDEDLKYKYRDSFLYELMSGRADKPIYYLVLIALDSLRKTHLRARKRALDQKLPTQVPAGLAWQRPLASGCGVFNLDSWNRNFPDYPVVRLPE